MTITGDSTFQDRIREKVIETRREWILFQRKKRHRTSSYFEETNERSRKRSSRQLIINEDISNLAEST